MRTVRWKLDKEIEEEDKKKIGENGKKYSRHKKNSTNGLTVAWVYCPLGVATP